MSASRRAVLQMVGATAGLGAVGPLVACTTPVASTPSPSPSATVSATPSVTPSATETASTLRFVTASDGHLGEKDTDSRRFLSDFVAAVNRQHADTPFDFAVINGDIGHGGVALLEEAKAGLDSLEMPYFASQGNHDGVSPAEWKQVWGTSANLVHRLGTRSIVIANTSNKAGDYLCADQSWLTKALAGEAGQRDVLVFMHITPNTWTKFGVACAEVRSLLASTPNLRAVFNGHDHDQSGVKVDEGVSYFFDAHYGGSWGTDYHGFRVAEVSGTGMETQVIDLAGTVRKRESLSW